MHVQNVSRSLGDMGGRAVRAPAFQLSNPGSSVVICEFVSNVVLSHASLLSWLHLSFEHFLMSSMINKSNDNGKLSSINFTCAKYNSKIFRRSSRGSYYHPNLGWSVPRGLQNSDPIPDLKFRLFKPYPRLNCN